MSKYSIDDLVAGFREEIPDHECAREDCDHRGGFVMFVLDGEDSINVSSSSHRMDPVSVIQAFVQTMDQAFIHNAGPIPVTLAVAQGREMLKRMAEDVAPPPEASMDIEDTIKKFVQSMRQDMEDRDGE